ncbi:MAG: ndmA [Acidimicrobiales bacterium]|nr:ndmA [Acidimicrobiales bacterium]
MTDAAELPGRTRDDAAVTEMLAAFWHPVCTLDELRASATRVLPVRLLGCDLAIAELSDDEHTIVAMDDRCVHRSTRLSVGWAEADGLRCAYHGWKWDGGGRCIEIPSMPDGPIPGRARVRAYRTKVVYDLVWVCLDERSSAEIPRSVAHGDPAVRIVPGVPYTWSVSALRRVENFVDLAHFAWVHVGTLGQRERPVPPLPEIERADGELRFTYDPPSDFDAGGAAMYGWSRYRMPMPCTVSIEFDLAGGARRTLWMTASPIDLDTCRCFWFMGRTDDLDGPDEPHVEFQRIVLAQDEPVVNNQVPRALPLDPADELSVRTDKVSIEYRRWLRELVDARIGAHA